MTRARIAYGAARIFTALLLALFAAAASFAGTLSGTVTNGTDGKPQAGVDMILFQLQGGMQQAATTKTDAAGHYSIDNSLIGGAPMLLRAVYHGVNYHEPVTPGKTTIDMQVYEPTDKAGAFSVSAHAIIVQPSGTDLTIGEEYNIQNNTQPPMAFYRADGSFLFTVPDGAQITDVSAVGGSGMPVIQTPLDKGANQRAIAFPFRPGTSGVRMSYHLPYANNAASLKFSSPYKADRLAIFAPPGVSVAGDGFMPAGQDQGFNVYMRESVPANTAVPVLISGTAPPPAQGTDGANAAGAAGDDSQNPSVNSRSDSAGAAPVASVTTIPARLDSLKWILVAGFAVIFVLGLTLLWRQAAAAPAAAVSNSANIPVVTSTVTPVAPPAPQAPVVTHTPQPASAIAAAAAQSAAEMERHVRGGLDELKDTLFRLELRHEAGTISAEDYARERDRIQKTLRDLVKG